MKNRKESTEGQIDFAKVKWQVPPGELHIFWYQRLLFLGYNTVADMARALDMTPQQAGNIFSGRSPVGVNILQRLNALDPDGSLRTVHVWIADEKRPRRESGK